MPVSLSGSLLITGSLTVTEGIIMSGSIASASYAVSSSNAFLATNVVGTANRILFNSATNTTTTSNNLTWENSINLMALGDTTGTAGTISKIALYTSSFGGYGLGVSPAQLDYVSDGSHVFYKNGVTPAELVRIANNGDVNISGSLNVINGITGNLTGTASYATNANLLDGLDSTVFTSTASFTAQTASFTAFTSSLNTFSASILSYTSSINAKTSSFATTSSNTFIGTQTITGSLLQSGNYTTTGTITAQTINVQQVTSSIVYSCGSNNFGTAISNIQQLTGSVGITGSLTLVGPMIGSSTMCSVMVNASCIGIGTTSPSTTLDVNGTGRFGSAATKLTTYSDSAYSGIFNGASLGSNESIYMGDARMFFFASGSERMRLISTGLGIGTTSPDIFGRGDGFDVGISSAGVGSTQNMSLQLNAGATAGRGAQLYMGQGGTRHFTISSNVTETSIGTTSNTPLRFVTCDSLERLRFTNTGIACFACRVCAPNINLSNGISINACSTVTVADWYNTNTDDGNGLYIKAGGVNSGKYIMALENAAGASRMIVLANGNVGIGLANPTAQFHICSAFSQTPLTVQGGGNGNIPIACFLSGPNQLALLDDNGNWILGGTSFSTRSTCTSGGLFTSGRVGLGTTNISSEANLFLGAQGVAEGGQLVLQKATNCNCATHLDNFNDSFRIMSGTNTGSTAVNMSINHTNGNATFNGYMTAFGYQSIKGTITLASGATGTIYNVGTGTGQDGIYYVAARVGGGSQIYFATGIVSAMASAPSQLFLTSLYDGANVTLSISDSNIRITNDGFATLTWSYSIIFQPVD
jgi:hypothetical protein